MGGPAPKIKNLSPITLILEMGPLEWHKVLKYFFGCDPPILKKLGSNCFFLGPPPAKLGGPIKILAPWGPSSFGERSDPKDIKIFIIAKQV